MTWLTPVSGLLLAAAVIPPLLLLYFLRLRRKEATIASTLLWEHAVEDLRANAPFQRLRPSILLFLQLLVLLLLALSIMQPQLAGEERSEGRVILLIDRSASMNTSDGEEGRTRLEQAIDAARGRVEAMYAGGLFGRSNVETMIIAFGEEAEVAKRFTRSRDDLLRALDRIEPTDGRSRLGPALQLARAYMTNTDPESNQAPDDPGTMEIYSDGRIADLDELAWRFETINYHRLGAEGTSNAAVGRVSVSRPFDRPTFVEVFAGLLTYDSNPVATDVELIVDGRVVAVQEVEIPAGSIDPGGVRRPGRTNVVFSPFEQAEEGVVTARIVRDDGLAVDNSAHAVLPPPKSLDVLLVGDRDSLIEDVLEGMPLERLRTIRPDEWVNRYTDVAEIDVDVVIGDDWVPPADAMPRGRYLTFGDTPNVPGYEAYGVAERGQLVIRTDGEHPVLRAVSLSDLVVYNATLVQPDRTVEVLVHGERGPLVLESRADGRHVLAAMFDPHDSSFPTIRSWVTFVFNAVDHLGRTGGDAADAMLVPGDAIAARLPLDTFRVMITTPDGEEREITTGDPERFSWGPVTRLGLHQLNWQGTSASDTGSRWIAVNLGDEAEVDIEPLAEIEVGTKTVKGEEVAGSGYRPIWPWAVGAAIAVLMLEWFFWTRKSSV